MTESSMESPINAEPPEKFAFGKNWAKFLRTVNAESIRSAEQSLQRLLTIESLDGKTFLDAGCGSGLFSLAAYRLGANVISFDVDQESVACAEYLHGEIDAPQRWTITHGSLLNESFLSHLPRADVVYCWGVAHHTGDMWRALENLSQCVAPEGKLVIAIYNDQQYVSRIWSGIKRIYQKLPRGLRPIYVSVIWFGLFLRRLMITIVASLIRLLTFRNPITPFRNWVQQVRGRGMSSWHDLIDWVGGWPFEVARPEDIFRFFRDRGFVLTELTTSGGHGCNEFVFQKTTPRS